LCSVFKTERLGFMADATGAGKDNQTGEYLKALLPTRPIAKLINSSASNILIQSCICLSARIGQSHNPRSTPFVLLKNHSIYPNPDQDTKIRSLEGWFTSAQR
jgi:hypothetical protein